MKGPKLSYSDNPLASFNLFLQDKRETIEAPQADICKQSTNKKVSFFPTRMDFSSITQKNFFKSKTNVFKQLQKVRLVKRAINRLRSRNFLFQKLKKNHLQIIGDVVHESKSKEGKKSKVTHIFETSYLFLRSLKACITSMLYRSSRNYSNSCLRFIQTINSNSFGTF